MRSLVIVMALLAGCASSTRESTIKTAFVTVQATDSAWHVYDSQHQDAIIASATSLADGKAKLAEYRRTQARVTGALTAALEAIKAAVTLNDDQSMAALKAALDDAVAAFAAAKGTTP